MGFFKPTDDGASETTADGSDVEAGDPNGGSGALSASSEGEATDALADLGVDLDDEPGSDTGGADGL